MKITVHPLFLAFGLFYAATGRIFEFAVCTVTAVIHETGHSVVAANLGYKLDKMVLMPFGAVVKGNIDGLKVRDEIKIALAGPAVNVAVGLLFTAAWWVFPECYAFTDTAAFANYSMAAINLIPAYPLDGGRVLSAALALKTGKEKAYKICRLSGVVLSVALIAAFVVTLFHRANYSVLFFAAFALFGTLSREKDNVYVKIGAGLTETKLMRGMPVLRQAVSANVTVKKLISVIDGAAVNEIDVYDGDEKIATLSQKDVTAIIERGEIYSRIKEYLQRTKKF